MRLLKLADRYTGWIGESAGPNARRFYKRWEHRHNRHAARRMCRNEPTNGY